MPRRSVFEFVIAISTFPSSLCPPYQRSCNLRYPWLARHEDPLPNDPGSPLRRPALGSFAAASATAMDRFRVTTLGLDALVSTSEALSRVRERARGSAQSWEGPPEAAGCEALSSASEPPSMG